METKLDAMTIEELKQAEENCLTKLKSMRDNIEQTLFNIIKDNGWIKAERKLTVVFNYFSTYGTKYLSFDIVLLDEQEKPIFAADLGLEIYKEDIKCDHGTSGKWSAKENPEFLERNKLEIALFENADKLAPIFDMFDEELEYELYKIGGEIEARKVQEEDAQREKEKNALLNSIKPRIDIYKETKWSNWYLKVIKVTSTNVLCEEHCAKDASSLSNNTYSSNKRISINDFFASVKAGSYVKVNEDEEEGE